ncbi:hypothetical protein [Spirosoma sp. KNUC1025]|uniref:hypothetical protein n=1 Tax=Spirosoma sp. KNUC1025 TaxID=2894082 RepID=UPI003864E537|nr:hypothetical protein LN737_00600 [Spirosoma sp. KNUC1025]
MPKQISFFLFGTLLSTLLLNACQHVQQQEPQPQPAALSVPDNLRDTKTPHSLIVLDESINFDLIKKQGQGPSERLIRWGTKESPGYWRTFTYDPAGKLLGIFQEEYGWQTVELARYQGDFLAESFTREAQSGFVFRFKRYQYDAQGRLSRTLLYGRGLDKQNQFRLSDWLTHTYDAKGELQQVRFESNSMPSFYWVYTYQKGDCVRQQQYRRASGGKVDDLREQIDIAYSSQINPLMELPLYDEYKYRFSRHYQAASVTTLYQSGTAERAPGCEFRGNFEYDGQGRLSRMRLSEGNLWEYFTYAP